MIKESLLWTKAIDPMNTRIVKEPTVLGAILIVIGAFAAIYMVFTLIAFL